MLYVHDIWVNWFEGEENGYNVCHFHEWRKSDSIELLDQIPVIYVEADLFDYIENDLQDIPRDLLDLVFERAYLKKQHQRIPLDHAFIMTEGVHTMVIDTLGYEIPIRKSRMIPRQERLVLELIKSRKPQEFSFNAKSQDKQYHILSLQPQYMLGLTRKERQLKHLLMLMLDQLNQSKRIDELRYWLTEWTPEQYESIQEMGFEQGFHYLVGEIKQGWSEKHDEICEKMAKGQPFFEKLWEMEQKKQNTIKNI